MQKVMRTLRCPIRKQEVIIRSGGPTMLLVGRDYKNQQWLKGDFRVRRWVVSQC